MPTMLPVNDGPSATTSASPFASRVRSSALIAGGLLFAALIGVTYGVSHRMVAEAPDGSAPAAAEPARIIPTDVMGMAVPWSPLTGDSSN